MEASRKYKTGDMIKRLVMEYIRKHVWRFAAAMVCMVLFALATGAMAKIIEPMINKVFTERDPAALVPIAMAVLAIFLVKGIAGFGQAVLMNDIGRRMIREIQIRLFKRIIALDLASFHRAGTGVLMARFISDAGSMYRAASTAVVAFGRDASSLIVLAGVMVSLDPRLSLLVLLVFPLAIIPAVVFGRRMRRIARASQEMAARMTGFLAQVFQGIRHVKAYNAEQREIANVTVALNQVARLAQKSGIARAANRPIMEMLTAISIVIVLWFGGNQVISSERTAGSFFAFITAMLLAYEPMKRLVGLNVSIQQGLASAERVFSTMDEVPMILDKPGATVLQHAKGFIELRNVKFSYDTVVPALRGLSLAAPAGKTVALVGPSGAGKSTILNLIPRFYDPDEGAVLIDGVDIRDVTQHSVRAQMALVSQDITLFNDTVRANIAYGRPNADDEDIERVAKDAYAFEFIKDLPSGYDTMIGEQGVRLSGGQRQRLSIARAMLKDAPILLLDEATSALDTQSEKYIQDALARLMDGRTTVIIAHRLSTISHADLIYVLEGGRVAEFGTHRGLIEKGGLFAHLWALQTAMGEHETGKRPIGAT